MSSYKISEPSALKFLKANGAVVDENGNVISDASDYWKKVYDQAEPKVAKYLHADGTIDENPGSGGGADLDDNKEVSITENGTVEILPAEGKDGMKKVTATVNVAGNNFEPYGCRIGEYYQSYIGVFPHNSEYTHKVYSQGKLYNDTEVYIFTNSTIADWYAEGFLATNGNNDLNVYSISSNNFDSYYLLAEPLGNENPSSKGWYEQYDHEGTIEMRKTSDTSVVVGKLYYMAYSDGDLYIVFEYNNKYYGLTTDSSNTLIAIPSQQGE